MVFLLSLIPHAWALRKGVGGSRPSKVLRAIDEGKVVKGAVFSDFGVRLKAKRTYALNSGEGDEVCDVHEFEGLCCQVFVYVEDGRVFAAQSFDASQQTYTWHFFDNETLRKYVAVTGSWQREGGHEARP